MSQIWWRYTPSADMRNPPPQQNAATTPAFLGPSRSSQAPKRAADEPRNTKNRVNIHPSVLIFQSQLFWTSRWANSFRASTSAVNQPPEGVG